MPYLNGKIVKDDEIDPAKHKFIGTFRDPNPTRYQGKGLIGCSCGCLLHTYLDSFQHWQMGHFDTPMYVDIDKQQKKLLTHCPQCGGRLVPALVSENSAWCDNCCCEITKEDSESEALKEE